MGRPARKDVVLLWLAMRPRAITVTAWMMTALNWLYFLTLDPSNHRFGVILISTFTLASLGQIVVWYYAHARNWARILVLLTSFLTFWNLYSLVYSHTWHRPTSRVGSVAMVVMVVGEALLGAYLVFYLNTREAKRYFAQAK